MRMIGLKIVPGTIYAESRALSFQCGDGGEQAITCRITAEALDDLVHLYHLDVRKDEAVDALVKEIEHLANEKFGAGRVEQNGELVIGTIDVLRYSFQHTKGSIV
jgi:hypothetical protein